MLSSESFTVHVPTVLIFSVLVMGSAAAIMSFFGLAQRVYRGYWWWVTAMWLVALGGALQWLRPVWPGAAVPGNLLLLAWPLLIITGLRRFHNRGQLPTSGAHDLLLFALCYLPWLGVWASPGLQGWRTLMFCTALATMHLYAVWFISRLDARRESRALRTMQLVMLAQGLLPLAVALGFVGPPPATVPPGQPLLGPLVIAPSMIAMLFTVYLCLVLTHERTEHDLRETQRQLRVLANTDMLTQVPNRRHFEELVGAALGRRGARAVLMLFDIDHFKQINDTHGHALGDAALKCVASCTRETLRARDVLGRVGGDEFMLLLPGASVDDALLVAERITRRLDNACLADGAQPLSLSFGVVEVGPEESFESAQHRADLALYEAKRQGRRRAVPARQDGPATVFDESRSLGLEAS